ncbi:MAG: mechanosensitive ion channel domain-containing protein [Actinomycetota bacterium]
MTDVLLAVGLALGGLGLGSIAAPITRRALGNRSQPAIREAAKGAGSFVFGLFSALGLVAALGVASPDSLKPLPGDIARFLPRAVVAGLLIISGRIVATLVVTAVGRAMLKATGRPQKPVLRTIEIVIVALVALIAAGQLGIDTTVLNILVAAIAFGGALAMALLIGIGGRDTSREIAAGRALGKYLAVGDSIDVAGVQGLVTEMRATVIIVRTGDGEVVLNNTMAQSAPMRLSRISRDTSGG